MPTATIVILVITVIVVVLTIVLYFVGKKAEARKAEQDEAAAKVSQTVSMLVIDKKKMKITDAGLPDEMVNQMPWYAKRSKMPIVKAKVGPKVMSFICDYEVFDLVPVKREVKAQVSGLYITGVKGLHGAKLDTTPKKKGIRGWLQRKQKELNK
ncbi:MAG: hypothetical protein K5675_07625 [Lachnospiraceae bacterium]|nr:hypothetical protein [Lachnospiraceae bacterium]